MEAIKDFLDYIINQITNIKVIDIIDIVIVAFALYYTFKFVSDKRAGKLLGGIFLLLILYIVSNFLEMRATSFIMQNVFSVGVLAIVVVFQPELRSALERMGGGSLKGLRGRFEKDENSVIRRSITEICIAAESLSSSMTGSLIVIERSTKLGDYIRTGTIIDAECSSFLLGNIFFAKAPLHDGAVIIRRGRIHAAGCFLPMSTNSDILKELGSRHRAALGISENSDALVIVVSEETGNISYALDGVLTRDMTRKSLEELIISTITFESAKSEKKWFRKNKKDT